jgi:hypothetical protein
MDLYCARCGEPVDNDEFHDRAEEVGSTYREVSRDFRSRGCAAIGARCSEPSTEVDRSYGLTRQAAAGAMYDLLGDDMDGAAAMLDDLGF